MVVVDQKHCFHSDDVISYSYPTTLSTQLDPFLGMCRRSMKSCAKKSEKEQERIGKSIVLLWYAFDLGLPQLVSILVDLLLVELCVQHCYTPHTPPIVKSNQNCASLWDLSNKHSGSHGLCFSI